jgi:cyclophilin family peptidyl-prolyl cis-trans isomerase
MTRATIATDIGDIEVDLYDQAAPKATKNFIDLANKGFYDDVIFHRVIPGFVIQGGDGQFGKKSALERSRVGTGGPGYKFEDEPVQGEYARGSLAMANSGPNTNGSQFFICTDDLSGRCRRTTHCSDRSPRASTSSTGSSRRRATRATCRTSPSR